MLDVFAMLGESGIRTSIKIVAILKPYMGPTIWERMGRETPSPDSMRLPV